MTYYIQKLTMLTNPSYYVEFGINREKATITIEDGAAHIEDHEHGRITIYNPRDFSVILREICDKEHLRS